MNDVVLLVDDHPIVRRGVALLLSPAPWVAAVLEAATVEEAERLAVLERPTVAVVDLGLPDGSGVDLIAALRGRVPGCRCLALTLEDDPRVVAECLAAGAHGYLRKETDPEEVLTAVRAVAGGSTVLGPHVAVGTLTGGRPRTLPAPLDALGDTDLRIVAGLGVGESTARIATALGLAEKTVQNRVSGLLTALGARDRLALALLAREHRLRPEDHLG